MHIVLKVNAVLKQSYDDVNVNLYPLLLRSLRSLRCPFCLANRLTALRAKGNAAGNRVSVTKSAGETITVTYNADDQVVSEKNSKTGDKIKYIYDENGNLTQKKVKGKKAVYEYDIENRLRSVSQGGQMRWLLHMMETATMFSYASLRLGRKATIVFRPPCCRIFQQIAFGSLGKSARYFR